MFLSDIEDEVVGCRWRRGRGRVSVGRVSEAVKSLDGELESDDNVARCLCRAVTCSSEGDNEDRRVVVYMVCDL